MQLDLVVRPRLLAIQNLFSGFKITAVREQLLGGNQPAPGGLVWPNTTGDTRGISEEHEESFVSDSIRIELKPMQIRTFILQLAQK